MLVEAVLLEGALEGLLIVTSIAIIRLIGIVLISLRRAAFY